MRDYPEFTVTTDNQTLEPVVVWLYRYDARDADYIVCYDNNKYNLWCIDSFIGAFCAWEDKVVSKSELGEDINNWIDKDPTPVYVKAGFKWDHLKVCECGGQTLQLPHSWWCDKYK